MVPSIMMPLVADILAADRGPFTRAPVPAVGAGLTVYVPAPHCTLQGGIYSMPQLAWTISLYLEMYGEHFNLTLPYLPPPFHFRHIPTVPEWSENIAPCFAGLLLRVRC